LTLKGPVAAIALAALLSGCAAGPSYRARSAEALGVPAHYTAPAREDAPQDLARWWGRFDDAELSGLVERALDANLDIAQAVARLRQARSALVQAQADFLPTLDASASGGRNFDNGAPDHSSLSVGANASWAIDLFGGTRRSVQASRADLAGAGYDLASVQTAIASETALNYIALREAQARLGIARDVLVTQEDNYQIAGWRVQAGLVSSLDVEQARTQLAQTRATIPTLETAVAAAQNRLAVLTGVAPGTLADELGMIGPIPVGPQEIAVGIPADTLRQRPDVRASERALAAATARIGVAQSQLLPALNISGNVGTSALSVGGLGDVITGGLFATLGQIIFDGGRRLAAVRAQRAAADGALAAYRQSVLTALEDVENGLVAVRSARAREIAIGEALEGANNAAILARSQYRAGLTDFQILLDSERQLLSARDSLALAKADEASSLIQLYLALGGGWDPLAPLPDGRRP
jgi:NodT family efflux transporter outer membrane factor (OMF) lipoprotein